MQIMNTINDPNDLTDVAMIASGYDDNQSETSEDSVILSKRNSPMKSRSNHQSRLLDDILDEKHKEKYLKLHDIIEI